MTQIIDLYFLFLHLVIEQKLVKVKASSELGYFYSTNK